MAVSSKPIELIQATSTAVRAARRSRNAVSAAAQGAGTEGSQGTITLAEVELPVGVVHALVRILDELSEGRDVAVLSEGDGGEVTTSQAAELLGMSRPTLINLLESGAIPFRKVGTHRRMALAEVLAYRRGGVPREPTREERLRALGEMAEYTDRLGLGY